MLISICQSLRMQVSCVLGPTRAFQIHVVLLYGTRKVNESLDLYCIYWELRHVAYKYIFLHISEPRLESKPCGAVYLQCEEWDIFHVKVHTI